MTGLPMLLKRMSVLSAVFAGVFLSGPGLAGPLADLGAEADQRLEAGDVAGALSVAGDSYAQIWDASPDIGIRDTLLVAEPASGYGLYNPRADNKFKSGEPVFVYAEPFGFGYGAAGEGLFSIGFAVDLRVISDKGEVMAEVSNIANLDLTSRYKNREFQANLTYTLDGIPAGVYVLETTLRDKNSAKTGTFQTEVEFTE
jgi:hypothetical protein